MSQVFRPHTDRIWEAKPDIMEVVQSAQNSNFSDLFGEPQVIQKPKPVQRNVLYFSHATGVEAQEATGILQGIRRLIKEVGSKIQVKNFGAFHINDGPYGNTDWYQRQALLNRNMGYGQQIDFYKITELLSQEPYQEHTPHMDVMAFDHDLTTSRLEVSNNFIYGGANYPHYVMSVARFRGIIKDPGLRQAALSVIAAHELGHNFGLVGRNFNCVNKIGLHCNGECGPCLMEQVDVPGCRTIEAQTRLIAYRTRWLCNDCLNEANFKKADFSSKGILW